MQILNDIISNLTKVANTMGYTGPTVDAIIYLAANSIYNNEINAITAVLEASPSRCKLVNSAIQHAKDVGYSVNRGTNQHIKIKGMTAVETKSYKKFDQAAKVGNYYLYFADDINVTSGTSYSEIEFILGKNILEEDITVSSGSDLLRLKSNKINYSNDITFSKVVNGTPELLQFSEIKRDIFEVGSTTKYWITTTTDYGLEAYIFSSDFSSNISSSIQFEADEVYRFRGVEYLDDTIELSAIRTIPGFKLSFNASTDVSDVFESSVNEVRTEDPVKIYKDSMKLLDSAFVIRTSDDIENAILAINNSIKACNIIVTPPVITVDEQGNTVGSNNGIIHVYYLTSDLNDEFGVSNTEIQIIINKLRNSYYVSQDFDFELAKGKLVTQIGNEVLPEPRKYKLYLHIFFKSEVDQGKVTDFIKSYNYSIGTLFDPGKINGDLVAEFPEISYVRFQKLIYGDDEDSDEHLVQLTNNEFINFDLNLKFTSFVG